MSNVKPGMALFLLLCRMTTKTRFPSSQYWRQVYLVTALAMILAVFFAQTHPSYLTQQWQRLRSVIFCSVSGYGVIPTLHWVWLNGGFGAPIVQVS